VKFTKTVASESLSLITELKKNFIIYPNPYKGNVKVILFSDAFTKAPVLLYNFTGKEIYSAAVKLTSGKNEINFNVKIKLGILLFKVNSKQTNYGTSKIIFK
jgi:hypothetical protein